MPSPVVRCPLCETPIQLPWVCRTCNGVQGRDDEHEDGGKVEVPAQADVHKERPCIQVDLGMGKELMQRLR